MRDPVKNWFEVSIRRGLKIEGGTIHYCKSRIDLPNPGFKNYYRRSTYHPGAAMDLQTQITLLWLMTCTGLVFFMQAGFACLEAGSVRSKNSINVALKNIISFIISAAVYYILAYAFQLGNPWVDGLIGH